MGGDERDGEAPPVRSMAKFSTPQRAAKNSVWPGNSKPDLVHAGLVNRSGNDRVNLPGESESDGFFQGGLGGARAPEWVGLTSVRRFAQEPVIGRGQFAGRECSLHDFRADSRRIAERDSDAFAHVIAQKSAASATRQLESLDVSLRAQAGEPVFLQLLRLFLAQSCFDLGPHFLVSGFTSPPWRASTFKM